MYPSGRLFKEFLAELYPNPHATRAGQSWDPWPRRLHPTSWAQEIPQCAMIGSGAGRARLRCHSTVPFYLSTLTL